MAYDKLQYQKQWRKKTKNASTNRYEKTIKGFLMRKYRNMLSRAAGIQHEKQHLYRSKYILSKEDFYNWAKSSNTFYKLFKEWELSNYDRKLCPSVDRMDPSKGYFVGNMQWLTHSQNSRLGSINRWQR